MFDYVTGCDLEKYCIEDEYGAVHKFEFVNNVPLNDSRSDIVVNFLNYNETDVKGKVKRFTWASDFVLSKANVYRIMRGGRAGWKIEK